MMQALIVFIITLQLCSLLLSFDGKHKLLPLRFGWATPSDSDGPISMPERVPPSRTTRVHQSSPTAQSMPSQAHAVNAAMLQQRSLGPHADLH